MQTLETPALTMVLTNRLAWHPASGRYLTQRRDPILYTAVVSYRTPRPSCILSTDTCMVIRLKMAFGALQAKSVAKSIDSLHCLVASNAGLHIPAEIMAVGSVQSAVFERAFVQAQNQTPICVTDGTLLPISHRFHRSRKDHCAHM